MNAAQFKRLTLLLTLPLFLCGVAFYHSVLPSSGLKFMICSTDGSCREMRYMERKNLERDRKHYLEIWSFEPRAPLSFYMQPFSTMGNITSTTPVFTGFNDFETEDKVALRLLGQDAVFLMGGNGDTPSAIGGRDLYLRCNNMSFEQDAEVISARCGGEGWRKKVHFTPGSDQTGFFTELYESIKATTRAKQATEIAIQAASYVSFLLIYGLLSAITAAAIFSYRYVRHGAAFQNLP